MSTYDKQIVRAKLCVDVKQHNKTNVEETVNHSLFFRGGRSVCIKQTIVDKEEN